MEPSQLRTLPESIGMWGGKAKVQGENCMLKEINSSV